MSMQDNVMNENSEAVTTVEDAIAITGGWGRFQWIMSFITMGNYIRSAFYYYPLPFMEMWPIYICTYPDGSTDTCTTKDFCGKTDITHTIDYSDPVSIHNFV